MGIEQLEARWRKSSSAGWLGRTKQMYSPRLVKEVLKALGKQLVDDGRVDSASQQQTFLSWTHKNGKKTSTISKEICSTQSRSRKEKEWKSIGC